MVFITTSVKNTKELMKNFFIALMLVISSPSWAWKPSDTVQIVVPFPPGGSTDVVGRIIAEGLQQQGISNVIVVNRAGAGGVVGTNSVINSKPDGHTLLLTGTSFLFNQLLNTPGANYNVVDSMNHVGIIGTVPNYVYMKSELKYRQFGEVVADIKKGKDLSWGVTNPGAEYTVAMISQSTGQKIKIVRYKGSAPAIQDLSGGHIDFVVDSGSSAVAQASVDAGRTRVIANLEPRSSSANTVDEHLAGVVTYSWFGLSLPKGSNPAAVLYYNQMLNNALKNSTIRQKLVNASVKPIGGDPLRFINLITQDLRTYEKISIQTE